MPFAVALFLDESSTDAITTLWQKLAEMHISASLVRFNYRPHITLGITDRLRIEPFKKYLEGFAGNHARMPLILSSLGVFPSPTAGAIFFGITPSRDLLDIHDDFSRSFAEFGENPRNYYRPGHWVPHCTLADGISCDVVPRAMEICQQSTLPIYVIATEIGILKFPPGYELLSYSLRSD